MSHTIYRIVFANQDQVYEIYAKHFNESEMYGLIEVEDLLFGETSSVLVDPYEERLRNEFKDVKKIFIPNHAIIRIDELTRPGKSKIRPMQSQTSITHLPYIKRERKDE